MDEIAKSLIISTPYAAALYALGRSAISLLKAYLEMVVLRHDRVLARLEVIERGLGIVPPPEPKPTQQEKEYDQFKASSLP